MSKLGKMELYRYDGAAWILEYAEKHGIDAAKEEMKRRRSNQVPLTIPDGELERFSTRYKQTIYKALEAMVILTLRDEFEFGRRRLERFHERYEQKAQDLIDDWYSWQDVVDTINDELGINIVIDDEVLEHEYH